MKRFSFILEEGGILILKHCIYVVKTSGWEGVSPIRESIVGLVAF